MISQSQIDQWHEDSRRIRNNQAKLLHLFDEVLKTIESVNALEVHRATKQIKK